jgi:hypothetical protein
MTGIRQSACITKTEVRYVVLELPAFKAGYDCESVDGLLVRFSQSCVVQKDQHMPKVVCVLDFTCTQKQLCR